MEYILAKGVFMKKILIAALLGLSATLFTGCVAPAPSYAYSEPSVTVAAPAPGYVWVDGDWYVDGGRWVQRPGRWVYPPRSGAHWRQGYWRHGNWHHGRWG